jgi:hypothetical protein
MKRKLQTKVNNACRWLCLHLLAQPDFPCKHPLREATSALPSRRPRVFVDCYRFTKLDYRFRRKLGQWTGLEAAVRKNGKVAKTYPEPTPHGGAAGDILAHLPVVDVAAGAARLPSRHAQHADCMIRQRIRMLRMAARKCFLRPFK